MYSTLESPTPPRSRLDEISTRWAQIGDPLQFVMRYGPAIERYLLALTGDRDAVADIRQDFLASMMQHRFASASEDQGRFRKYLKTAVRNAVRMHFRKQRSRPDLAADDEALPSIPSREQAAEAEWLAEWCRCVLDRTWAALHRRQQEANDLRPFYILKLHVEFGATETSEQLAARVALQTGQQLRADAFRQQLGRARRVFAELLVREVAQTLEAPTTADLEEELIETGLMTSIRQFLPDDWTECLRVS